MALRDDLETWALKPFLSQAYVVEAISSHQYKTDEAFRSAVASKLSISENTGTTTTVHATQDPEITETGAGLGQTTTDAGVARTAEQKSAEAEMIATYGPLSVAPAARKPTA